MAQILELLCMSFFSPHKQRVRRGKWGTLRIFLWGVKTGIHKCRVPPETCSICDQRSAAWVCFSVLKQVSKLGFTVQLCHSCLEILNFLCSHTPLVQAPVWHKALRCICFVDGSQSDHLSPHTFTPGTKMTSVSTTKSQSDYVPGQIHQMECLPDSLDLFHMSKGEEKWLDDPSVCYV